MIFLACDSRMGFVELAMETKGSHHIFFQHVPFLFQHVLHATSFCTLDYQCAKINHFLFLLLWHGPLRRDE
jgi:hypothetical protein